MRTGRNPNLGPNAPYGIFTPGGESDRIAGSPAARAMQPPSPVDNHPSLQALRAISSGNHNLQGSMPDIEQRFPSGPVSGAGHYADALANPASNGMLPSNYGANQVYQAHGHMPRTTVGGNFGQGTPNITEDDLRIARNIGIQGNGREAMLASINKRPTGYQPTPRPELDLAQKPQFPAGQYTETPGGSLTPNQGSSAAKRVEAAKQANTASAPARQKYLAGRKAELGKRRELATAKAQEKDKGRRDAVRVKRGHLTVEERFAAANPGAYQARKGMEARMNGEQLMADKRLGLAERQITSNEKIAEGRNKAIVDAQRARTEAENGPAAPKPPPLATAPSLPEQVTGSVRDKATGGDIEGARADLAANGVTNKEDQDKILREATGDQELGLGLTEKPMRPGPASPMDLTNPFSPQAWAGKIGRYIAGKITGKQTKDMQRGPRK